MQHDEIRCIGIREWERKPRKREVTLNVTVAGKVLWPDCNLAVYRIRD